MIIVSQDKSVIVNFNNVEAIEIGNAEENYGKGIIFVRLKSDYFYRIGGYKTEERAKEVLQEIIKEYKGTEAFKACANRISDKVGTIAIEEGFAYEMPLE